MASTGEVASFGEDKYDAILTSMLSSGFKIPKASVFLCLGPYHSKVEFMDSARALASLGLELFCTQGTYDFYKAQGLEVSLLRKPLERAQSGPNCEEYLADGKIDLVVNVRDSHANEEQITNGYLIRRKVPRHFLCTS